MSPPATRRDSTAEHATANADEAEPPAAAPVTGAGAGGSPVAVSCADATDANITATAAATASNTAPREAIAEKKTAGEHSNNETASEEARQKHAAVHRLSEGKREE
ncbi:hypothetical protein ABZP36_023842 [Zizania latifolia]